MKMLRQWKARRVKGRRKKKKDDMNEEEEDEDVGEDQDQK